MSKGNPLLGYSRGKVGDLVLTRGEGQQIMRARNRSPRNPKTQKQMYQRAIMATIMQAYKTGLVIFDHSFQGKKKGLENMKQFLSINAKKLRANIISDLGANTVTSSVVSPGAITPVPYSYRISEGTYSPSPLITELTSSGSSVQVTYGGRDTDNVADVFVPGDIHTIVAIGITTDPQYSTDDTVSPATIFGFIRLTVKDTLPEGTIEGKKYADIFEIETYNANTIAGTNLIGSFDVGEMLGALYGCVGIIHSREDSGLRSTTNMLCPEVSWGIVPANVPEVWNAAVPGLGRSELILEGGDE